ncbi:MAG: sn-glycerol-3-phosphate ABC transporter ATP-binding protein UgpC [Phenylobacterium sp.]
MACLDLIHVSKAFGALKVLEDVSLRIEAGEFVAFLGPSGCGKSTLLRMIAGLERLDDGEIHIDGRRVDQAPPGDRGVAMVFQNYALYPHMTIRENIAFGLRNVGVEAGEIATRVAEAAKILEIEPLLAQKPGQLSGGQRQRVAIGRAIVKHPKLFLFDEPLSNLDAALRMRTRLELAQLRRRLETTMILVTHDQVEAMTLADRIVVMHERKIQQVGAPMEIYARPATAFVAGFVGSPSMTFLPATLTTGGGGLARVKLGCGSTVQTQVPRAGLDEGGPRLGVRSEDVAVTAPGAGDADAVVDLLERLGERTLVYARLKDGAAIVAGDAGVCRLQAGEVIGLKFNGAGAHLFDAEGRGYHAVDAQP